MQCPSCDHEAPAAAFGDPLRCPDCGAFYAKALAIKLKAELAPAVNPQAVAEPAPPIKSAKTERNPNHLPGWVTLLSLGLVVVWIWWMANHSAGSGEQAGVNSKAQLSSKDMARYLCKVAIERSLKAPATADISELYIDGTAGIGIWTIRGVVDSENSYGARLRNRYHCKISVPDESVLTFELKDW